MLIELGGPELVTTLLGQGPKQRITQPAVYATANLAAGNQGAQDALADAGGSSIPGRQACSIGPAETDSLTPTATDSGRRMWEVH